MSNHMKKNIFTLTILMLMLISHGCGYGKISPQSYEYAKGLYTICNLQKKEQLELVSIKIAESLKKKEIQQHEARWLESIIQQAQTGKWEEGMTAARKILTSQL